jgi:UDPglucose 6-dehydrogenase
VFTSDPTRLYESADIVFVCVDTPARPDGSGDLSRVNAVIADIPRWADPLLVMKSTVPVGTGHRVLAALHADGRGDIGYVSNPEFLREGSAIADVMHPDRVVIGGFHREQVDRIESLYEDLNAPILKTDVTSAELIKYASNAFLATKISFINEIANLCDTVGASVDMVSQGIGLDHRIGSSFLHAGIGYGGSCFPKDIAALASVARAHAVELRTVAAARETNDKQPRIVLDRLEDHLGGLPGARIAILGLAFKAHTSDTRNSVGIRLAHLLSEAGAEVVAYDPIVSQLDEEHGWTLARTLGQAVCEADAAVIATEWPEFHQLLRGELVQSMRRALLVDGRNLLDPAAARAAGFAYVGIGRSGAAPQLEAPHSAPLRLAA